MANHKELKVWQASVDLVTDIYSLSNLFPKDDLYGLTSQMRRAALSIPSNIAEGCGRNHDKELIQFLYIALGSYSELETQIIVAKNIGYIKELDFNQLTEKLAEVGKLLVGFINSIKNKNKH